MQPWGGRLAGRLDDGLVMRRRGLKRDLYRLGSVLSK